jgi:predicted alpha-1,2-mannosidase
MTFQKSVATLLGCSFIAISANAEFDPTQEPLPLVGTDAHGHAFPGATVPFGMVQLSPDTPLQGWDGSSGYHYTDSAILGFSHTHLAGTGVGGLGDIMLMPTVGEIAFEAGTPGHGYSSKFSHGKETATPGYYRVFLEDPKVTAELTATPRCGFHKYTFPQSDQSHIVLDLAHGVGSQPRETELNIEGSDTITGSRLCDDWGGKRTEYFVMQFSRPFDSTEIERDGERLAADAKEGKGTKVKAVVNYKTKDGEAVLVKVGISATSVEGARKNLAAEIPGFDFEATHAAAVKQWKDIFDEVKIEAPDLGTRRTFYANLYLSCLAPTLFADADGTYRGMDHQNHAGGNFKNYSTFSIWDIYRAEWPLMTLLHPERVDDMVQSMLTEYKELGQHTTPIWPLCDNETWCMIGYHSVDMIADAYLKGFRGFDAEAAYQAMRDTAMQNRNGLASYKRRGYVASAPGEQATSKTIEYSFDDWCIARMAEALGHKDDAALFYKRSANYRNLFDTTTQFFRGRKGRGGAWRTPFVDNALVGDEYTEADAWQYAFAIQQDAPGMISLYGGDAGFLRKLDLLFATNSIIQTDIPDISGLIGQYSQGDEQCHHVAYLYDYAGAPYKTQKWVRKVMATLYNDTPSGQCGNVDCGQMSAWYIFSALGFYPMNPDSGVLAIGSPAINKAVIQLDNDKYHGKTFTVIAKRNSPSNIYIQSAKLNGKPLTKPWITFDDVTAGGTLEFVMGSKPKTDWGAAVGDRPPATMPADFHYAALLEPASDKPIRLALPIRVVCGSDDRVGAFVPDPNMTEGTLNHSDATVDTSAPHAAPALVYRDERYGKDFTYKFPVPKDDHYIVRLHFAEVFDTGEDVRLENIEINGKPVLTDFDITAAAGGKDKAVVKEFSGITPNADGEIRIRISSSDRSQDHNAKISGIEIFNREADAAANWPGPYLFKTADGKCEITINTSSAPDLTDWATNKLAPTLAEWYPKIAAMLPSEGFAPPTKCSFTLEPGDGVAGTSGAQVTANSTWLAGELDRDATGALIHETVHIIQDYGWGRQENPDATRSPGWLVEGVADYIRWFRFEPNSHGADMVWMQKQKRVGHYNDSYRVTANFLNWVSENYDRDIVPKLNAAMREGKYKDAIWEQNTGKTVEALGSEWEKYVATQMPAHSASAK